MDSETYNTIKSFGKNHFGSMYYDNMKLTDVRFMCKICLDYICETRNINYKRNKENVRNPFLELQSENIISVIERIKEARCHRCQD